ncbi:MAG TPA: ABC transporter ATP-binding protein [Armatimonadota bacterium]|jgi:ABC-2 type transport system ATP-binding protein
MPILDAHDLWKTFRSRRRTVDAVRGVSLRLEAGEVLGFLGPNGAGKTTTIKMLAGLVRPDRGWVRIMARDPHRDPGTLYQVGAVLEGNRNVYWRLTPHENLVYFGVLRGLSAREAQRRGDELLERFNLADKRRETVQQLSRGMQQKLAIAVAFIHQPKLLLLDEPTLGLDVEAAEAVKTLIREIAAAGHAILLTTHQLGVAEELSDRVAIIRQGEIITEEPTQELIRRYSGQAFTIEVQGTPSPAQTAALIALGAEVHFERICYLGASENLYRVFDILRPLPLVKVEKDQADLTEVFLKLMREGADA